MTTANLSTFNVVRVQLWNQVLCNNESFLLDQQMLICVLKIWPFENMVQCEVMSITSWTIFPPWTLPRLLLTQAHAPSMHLISPAQFTIGNRTSTYSDPLLNETTCRTTRPTTTTAEAVILLPSSTCSTSSASASTTRSTCRPLSRVDPLRPRPFSLLELAIHLYATRTTKETEIGDSSVLARHGKFCIFNWPLHSFLSQIHRSINSLQLFFVIS